MYILHNIHIYIIQHIGDYTIFPEVISKLMKRFTTYSCDSIHVEVKHKRIRVRQTKKIPNSLSNTTNRDSIDFLYNDDTNCDNAESISKADVPYLGNINIIYI